jgi:single-stranded-DNA-specific exonuclease
LAYYGLKQIEKNERHGLQALKKVAGVPDKLTTSQVVFTLAPRINAAGRIADAKHVVQLLLAKTKEEADELAELLNGLNAERKNFDQTITADAISMIENNEMFLKAKSTVLYKEDWHKGVIGIVASRCIEKHYKPTVILTKSNENAAGSARSVEGFDLYQALEQCSEHLIQFGGHKFAAGMTMEISQIESFRKRFDEVVTSLITDEMLIPSILIDKEIELNRINLKFYDIINQFAPFGPGNMQPVFVSKGVKDTGYAKLLKEEHIKLTISQDSTFEIEAIGFGMPQHFERIKNGDRFDVCYTIGLNEYNGRTSIQLMIKDIQFI